MDLYTNFTDLAVTVLLLGVVAAVASVGVLATLIVTNRRERLAQHESMRSYYLAPTHSA